MKPLNRSIRQAVVALGFALVFAGPAAAAGEAHEHGQGHGAGEAKLVLDHGKKWQTDAPLRRGMENIRAVLATRQKPEALAELVNAEVAYIVQNCKLPADADAQLHLLIAELLAGADEMKGARAGEGVERVVKALNEYGRYFDHPGWRKL
jgi:hypothetical protein